MRARRCARCKAAVSRQLDRTAANGGPGVAERNSAALRNRFETAGRSRSNWTASVQGMTPMLLQALRTSELHRYSTIDVPSTAVRSANNSVSRIVSGPGAPLPMVRPSTLTTGTSSPIVPVQKTSSAR